MKWSERGPVPWPFVRRSRFVKELETQGQAYRQEVLATQAQAAAERARHADEEDRMLDVVRHLEGFYQDGVYHGVETHSNDGRPLHFHMGPPQRDVYTDSLTFGLRVSNMLIHRARGAERNDLYLLFEKVVRDLTASVIREVMEPTDPLKGGT